MIVLRFLFSAFGGVSRALGNVVRWLAANPNRIIMAALLAVQLVLGLLFLNARAEAASDRELRVRITSLYDSERAAHQVTRQDYARAQLAAAAKDRARVAAVAADYQQQMKVITHDNEDLRARLRERALGFVRGTNPAKPVKTASGPSAGELMPDISGMSPEPVPPAGHAGLSKSPTSDGRITATDALAIADAYAQLEGLIAAWHAAHRASRAGQDAVGQGVPTQLHTLSELSPRHAEN